MEFENHKLMRVQENWYKMNFNNKGKIIIWRNPANIVTENNFKSK